MYSLNTFSITRLNNREFLGLMLNMSKAIKEQSSASLGLDAALIQAFNMNLKKLTDQVYTAPGSDYTAAMQAADDKRDKIYKRIRLRLQMVEYAEQDEALNACRDVVKKLILDKYTGAVTLLPMHEETGVLEGFLLDIEQKLDMEAQEALGISADVSKLKAANDEFMTAYGARTSERVAGGSGMTVQIRANLYEIYQRISFIVQYLANDTAEANAEKSEACQAFIATMNVILADAKTRYNSRLNKGGGVGTEGEGDGSSEEGENKPSGEEPSGTENKPSTDKPGGGDAPSGGDASGNDNGFEEDEDGRVWM